VGFTLLFGILSGYFCCRLVINTSFVVSLSFSHPVLPTPISRNLSVDLCAARSLLVLEVACNSLFISSTSRYSYFICCASLFGNRFTTNDLHCSYWYVYAHVLMRFAAGRRVFGRQIWLILHARQRIFRMIVANRRVETISFSFEGDLALLKAIVHVNFDFKMK